MILRLLLSKIAPRKRIWFTASRQHVSHCRWQTRGGFILRIGGVACAQRKCVLEEKERILPIKRIKMENEKGSGKARVKRETFIVRVACAACFPSPLQFCECIQKQPMRKCLRLPHCCAAWSFFFMFTSAVCKNNVRRKVMSHQKGCCSHNFLIDVNALGRFPVYSTIGELQ